MLEIAIRAAREAGALLRTHVGRDFEVSHKGPIDLVTEVDMASERLVKDILTTYYPRHAVLGEEYGESGAAPEGAEYRWVIDPLDGTTNYAHGYPHFCVSIGLEQRGEPLLGVVYDPMRDELFVAERGAGATLNNRRIRASRTAVLREALLCTGFPYEYTERYRANLEYFKAFSLSAQGVRRDGSAALDLCYVACGRLDGFWEAGLKPWDSAAAALMITEAGGRVTDYAGGAFDPFRPQLVASNGRIHEEMMAVIARGAE